METVKRQGMSARIIKTMGLFGGVQGLVLLCGVVRTKLVALWIGAAGVGLFSIYNSAIDLVVTVAMLGIAASAVRDIAAAPEGMKNLMARAALRWGWVLGAVGAVAIAAMAPVFSRHSFGDDSHAWAFIALAAAVMMNSLTSIRSGIMQGLKEYRRMARASMWGTAAGVALSAPLFYFLRVDSIVPAILIFSAAMLVPTAMAMPRLRSDEPLGWRQTLSLGRGFIILGAYITLSQATSYCVNYLFASWLSTTASVDEVGFYQAGFNLFNRYAGLIFAAIGVEYFPRLSMAADRRRRVEVFVNHESMLILWLILPLTTLFIIAGPLLVRLLYSEAFLPIVPMISAGIIGVTLRGLSWCIAFTILARGDGLLYLVSEVSSALVCLGLNIAGYRLGGLTGLGISYTVWYAVYLAIVAVIYLRRYGLRINRSVWWLTGACLATGSLMALTEIAWPALEPLNWAAAAASVVVSGRALRRLWRH